MACLGAGLVALTVGLTAAFFDLMLLGNIASDNDSEIIWLISRLVASAYVRRIGVACMATVVAYYRAAWRIPLAALTLASFVLHQHTLRIVADNHETAAGVRERLVRYTVDDDGLDKTSGYYYSKDGLDFEPLDKMMADSGHTQMYYKEGGQWKQL